MAVSKIHSIVITGANRGLGFEMVKQLAESRSPNCRIFAGCRDPDAAKSKSLQELAKKHSRVITVVKLDVTDPNSIKDAAKKVGAQLEGGRLNVLVNNAGILIRGTMQSTTDQHVQESFNTNVMGPVRVFKEFLPYLRAAAKASPEQGMSCAKAAVINISTIGGSIATIPEIYGFFPAFPYNISKAGFNMFNQCATYEFKKDGIMFVLIHPGWVRTDMGGPDGEIDAPESVQGLLNVMNSLTEKQNGAFLDYKGNPVPW
ncbi:hypothetical protein Z043_120803 [Scleropages formosus]|uniref:Zgc:123284 n=1 Tax=Scleropages formosus TaxID=113540 RepID=A0A0N8JWJ8_SCLFO|nr:uncharacterized protein LOC108935771 [Scleropages formosus]KPP61137.1 hypothetical protein Z043_120803 [Scleropages formosus]